MRRRVRIVGLLGLVLSCCSSAPAPERSAPADEPADSARSAPGADAAPPPAGHLGRPVDLAGDDCRPFLSHLVANDVAKLQVSGKALYSAMLNEAGGVIDDLIIYFLSDTRFRIVVNAGTAEKDLAWIHQQAAAFKVHDEIQIVEGRRFNLGQNEVIVGWGAVQEFAGLEVGAKIKVGKPNAAEDVERLRRQRDRRDEHGLQVVERNPQDQEPGAGEGQVRGILMPRGAAGAAGAGPAAPGRRSRPAPSGSPARSRPRGIASAAQATPPPASGGARPCGPGPRR